MAKYGYYNLFMYPFILRFVRREFVCREIKNSFICQPVVKTIDVNRLRKVSRKTEIVLRTLCNLSLRADNDIIPQVLPAKLVRTRMSVNAGLEK